MFTHPHCLYLSLACRAARDLGTVFLRVGIAVVTEVEIAALAAAVRSLACALCSSRCIEINASCQFIFGDANRWVVAWLHAGRSVALRVRVARVFEVVDRILDLRRDLVVATHLVIVPQHHECVL